MTPEQHLPTGWRWLRVADVASGRDHALAIGPFGSDLLTSDFVDAGVPVVFVRNIRPNAFERAGMRFVSAAKADALAPHAVRPGELVITKMGAPPCIAAVYPDDLPPAIVTADVIKLTTDPNVVDAPYLCRYLNSAAARASVERFTSGVTRPKVTLGAFKALVVPVPPLPEQRRIAALLDKSDAIRRKRQQAIRLADELVRSAFLDMFGDPVTNPKAYPICRLGETAAIVSGVTKGRKLDPARVVSVPYMRVANVQDGHLLLHDIKEIEALPEEVARYRLETGDVLLTEGGDPDKLGRGAVWRGGIDPCIHQNHIFRVRANASTLLPDFLSAQLGSARGKRYFARAAKQTTGIASINMTQLSAFPVLVPPLETQAAYGAFVERFRAFEHRLADRHKACDRLCESLAHAAFQGDS